jgi:hypothetical protein
MNPKATATGRTNAKTANPTRLFLTRLIDYAGLFPPAALNMREVVKNYATYLGSEHAWVLGRFIVPAARLGEFEETLQSLPEPPKPWNLSVLLGPDPAADLTRITSMWGGHSHPPVIDSVEVKANTPEEVRSLATLIPRGLTSYFEIPLTGHDRECIAAIADCGRAAKIRTGGETADKFPEPSRVIEFIRLCADAKVPFKATAGLHHPIRSVHRLTYQPDSASALMHGFLNVFLAAAFLHAGLEPQAAGELLEERSAGAIRFDAEGIMWREHHLNANQIASARQHFSISFGSCSFTEPMDDLKTLGLL